MADTSRVELTLALRTTLQGNPEALAYLDRLEQSAKQTSDHVGAAFDKLAKKLEQKFSPAELFGDFIKGFGIGSAFSLLNQFVNYNEAYYRLQTLTNALDKAKFLGQSIGSGYGAVKISDLDLSGLTTSYKSNYATPGSYDYIPPPDVLNQRIEGALNNFLGDLDKQSEQSTSLKEISAAAQATTNVITEINGQLHIILNG